MARIHPGTRIRLPTITVAATGTVSVPAYTGLTATFTVETTATSGTYPFMMGFVAEEGATDILAFDKANVKYSVKRRWPDLSIKHAVITGRVALTQNVPLTVTVTNGTTATGTLLTVGNIRTANPTATIDCGPFGSRTLSSLISAAPFDTPVATSEMIECRWRGQIGSDATLVAWFQVRLYADGRVWVRATCENGYIVDPNTICIDKGYTPTITINSVVVFTPVNPTFTGSITGGILTFSGVTNGPIPKGYYLTGTGVNAGTQIGGYVSGDPNTAGQLFVSGSQTLSSRAMSTSFANFGHTRYFAEGWIGGDPATIAKQDVGYLRDIRFVPNYGWRVPSTGKLNAITQTYVPNTIGDLLLNFTDTGFSEQVGVLPNWDALYLTSGDTRAYHSVMANSAALNSYGIVWRDPATNLPIKITDFTHWTDGGENGTTGNYITGSCNVWDAAHGLSSGYLAYMLTGDVFHLETMAFNSTRIYLAQSFVTFSVVDGGYGTDRFITEQQRGIGWSMRTLGQYVALAPDSDAVAADCRTWLGNLIHKFYGFITATGASQIGYPFIWGSYTPGSGLSIAPWMQHFWISAVGHISDLGTEVSNETELTALRDFMYQGIVGILGASGINNYCYADATKYNIRLSNTVIGALEFAYPTQFHQTWGQIYTHTWGVDNVTCGSTLLNQDGGSPVSEASENYWGNILPAISYAVDHGATGAAAAFARLTGATNWSSIVDNTYHGGFDDLPLMGIVPTNFNPRLPKWLRDAAPAVGGWVEIANTNISSVLGVGGLTASRLDPWGCLAVNREGSKLYSAANGGHGDYGGNEVLTLSLSADVPAWTLLRAPSTVNANQNYFNDGRPNATHLYFGEHFNPLTSKIFRFGMASRYSDSGGDVNQVDSFSLITNDWAAQDAEPDVPSTGATTGGSMAQHPTTFDVYMAIGPFIYKWAAATETWSAASTGSTPSSNLAEYCSAIDSSRDKMLFAMRTGSGPQLYDIGTQTFSLPTLTGTTITPADNQGLTYDIGLDRYLLKTDNPGPNVYTIHPTTFVMAAMTVTGSPPRVVAHQSGVYGKWHYLPELGGCVFAAGDSANLWFLKTGDPV